MRAAAADFGVASRPPTVARQASILRNASWSPAWPAIVALQPHGHRPGFFCAAGAGTTCSRWPNSPRHLGLASTVYGFAAAGQDGQRAPLRTWDSLAAHFVREMRAVQARGPYFLGGSSYGGIVGVRDGAATDARRRGGRPAGALRHARTGISAASAATRRRDSICSAGLATLFRSRRSVDGLRCAARCSGSGREA